MEKRTYKHLQTADKEANFNKGNERLELLKSFKRMLVNSTSLRFLSSIITLSILNVANSSFAFPAQVRDCGQQNEDSCLATYWYPNTNSVTTLTLSKNTQVEILYCRIVENDQGRWCYLEGYENFQRKSILAPRWVLYVNICADSDDGFPLLYCKPNSINQRLQNVNNFVKKQLIRQFYCTPGKSPIAWFDREITDNLCQPSRSIEGSVSQ
ncbi:MAG: hypothetical protein V7K50_08955 [Nostoc sp.]|uniref:hypothetical protein n=1 Tax=Nostoc sp. TaxID=1180 RepID=UPI002FFC11E3